MKHRRTLKPHDAPAPLTPAQLIGYGTPIAMLLSALICTLVGAWGRSW